MKQNKLFLFLLLVWSLGVITVCEASKPEEDSALTRCDITEVLSASSKMLGQPDNIQNLKDTLLQLTACLNSFSPEIKELVEAVRSLAAGQYASALNHLQIGYDLSRDSVYRTSMTSLKGVVFFLQGNEQRLRKHADSANVSFNNARAIFLSTAENSPLDTTAWFMIASISIVLLDFEAGLQYSDKVIAMDSSFAAAWLMRALALERFHLWQKALESVNRVLVLGETNFKWQAWQHRGIALVNLKQYQEGLNSLDTSLSVKQNEAETWSFRGLALNGLGRAQEALESFTIALKHDASFVEARNNRAAIYLQQKQHEAALLDCDSVLLFSPTWEVIWVNRCTALIGLQRMDEALESVNRAIELKPDFTNAWLKQAVVYFLIARYEDAFRSIEKALEIAPLGWEYFALAIQMRNEIKMSLDNLGAAALNSIK